MGEFIGKSLSPHGKRYQSFERCAWHDFPQKDINTIINQFRKRLRMVKEVEGKHIEQFFFYFQLRQLCSLVNLCIDFIFNITP